MREIPLTRGKVALVDDEDFEHLSHFKWNAHKCRNTYYATRQSRVADGRARFIRMHIEIVGTPVGMVTDHINGNGLDNRRKNLRIVTNRENAQNRHVLKTSKYPGVTWQKEPGKWSARIMIDGRVRSLGLFSDEEKAADAYLNACDNPEMIPPIQIKTSRYPGVDWHKKTGKWRARVRVDGEQYHIGVFSNEVEAAQAYIDQCKERGVDLF